MKLVDHALGVGIIFVENEFAFAIPPEPVLDNVVDWDVQIAILFGHTENFFLRLVAVLALPETVGPAAKHGRLSGQIAVAGDNFVEIGAVEKVIIDYVGDLGTDVQEIRKLVVEAAARIVV